MKKPLKKDFCRPFFMNKELMLFDSKSYAKVAIKYIEYVETQRDEFLVAFKAIIREDGGENKTADGILSNIYKITRQQIKNSQ